MICTQAWVQHKCIKSLHEVWRMFERRLSVKFESEIMNTRRVSERGLEGRYGVVMLLGKDVRKVIVIADP